jgi:hypothetical protein
VAGRGRIAYLLGVSLSRRRAMNKEPHFPEPQLTREEAIALAETQWWKYRSAGEIVRFQLFQEKLAMNFGDFQMAVEEAVGRPVWTHEFAGDGCRILQNEYLTRRP